MSWFVVFEEADGRLVSQGTVVAEVLRGGLSVKDLGTPPDLRRAMWDETTRDFVARPAKVLGDVYDDTIATIRGLGVNLNASAQAIVKQALIDTIGSDRFYNAASGWRKREGVQSGG